MMEPAFPPPHLATWLTIMLAMAVSLLSAVQLVYGVPTLEDTPLDPILATAGETVLLDCVVRHIDNYTVLWKRAIRGSNRTETLTAAYVLVTEDERFSLLHQPDHDTWVLRIHPAQVTDSGRYICEVNTNPSIQIYRLLSIIENNPSETTFPLYHNYTNCCIYNNVPSTCLHFCSLESVLKGGHPDPWQCMDHLPAITRCLTDGRNHLPCCVQQNIPEICRSVCVGNYKLSTVLQHQSCIGYTIPTLACIAEGIELLPGRPDQITAEPISSTELKISWLPPSQSVPVKYYMINVTRLYALSDIKDKDFDLINETLPSKNAYGTSSYTYSASSATVSANSTTYIEKELEPATMYDIQMMSVNDHGTSLPTVSLRVFTLLANNTKEISATIETPALPNITSCCETHGVPAGRCLNSLCDPSHAEEARLSDIMVCAPWANVTFDCMAGGVDHSHCCQQRGLPEVCLDFCRGNVTQLDFRHFVCLEHMDVYGNCLLEHYGVLPGPPEDFTTLVVHAEWAVLEWKPPKLLPQTVTSYILFWRAIDEELAEFHVLSNVNSPYLFDDLIPQTPYEVYAIARNKHGTSRESAHVLFTTPKLPFPNETASEYSTAYNETGCCVAAGLQEHCFPLCSYQMKMEDLQNLAFKCANQLEILARCGAGGRDHGPCCQHLQVHWNCLPLCSGVFEMTPRTAVLSCMGDIGKILQCMMDGTETLPGNPEDLQAIGVNSTAVSLIWQPPHTGAKPTSYEVRYSMTAEKIPTHPLDYNKSVNVTTPKVVLDELKPDEHYSIHVIAYNEHGYSLPSLVIVAHTPEFGTLNATLNGRLSPPHSLEVIHQTMDSITLSWHSPSYLPVNASLRYLVFYQPLNNSEDLEHSMTSAATTFTRITLTNLTLNTQYAIAVKALSGTSESDLSETVLAWTDPAIPAFLNPPVIVPPEPVMEGSNITVLCVATGMPVPNVTLYINGMLKEWQQNHVALVLPNIQRNTTKVDCFADNGHGQGAQSSLSININFRPSISSNVNTVVAIPGNSAQLQCLVSGNPEPRVLWYRDKEQREPVREIENVLKLEVKPHVKKRYTYVATLEILKVDEADVGEYFCHAENHYGKDMLNFTLALAERYANTSACCEEKGVSQECRDACTFDINISVALNKPRCFRELDKLMFCAADGSDHRHCCRKNGVSRSCLRWCQGRPIVNTHLCILHSVKEIVGCFEDGKSLLPGPPQNIHARYLPHNTIEIDWDAPQKNPQAVQWYRISWKPVGSRNAQRNQTRHSPLLLTNLQPGTTYEVAVKAGNRFGTSHHSEAIVVKLHGSDSNSGVKVAVGVVVCALLLVLAGAVGIYMYLRLHGKPAPGTSVSFENPTYMKDTPQVAPFSPERNGGSQNMIVSPNFPDFESKQPGQYNYCQDLRLPNGQA